MGLLFHTDPVKGTYWDESAFYEFTAREIDELETATAELHRLCVETAQAVVQEGRLAELGIPAVAHPLIERTISSDTPSLYGRFDLIYDGRTPPKMLEYNADTPTSLLEAAVIQWHWLQELDPSADQFNSLWEGLVETWRTLRAERRLKGSVVHFAHEGGLEDGMTVTLLRDTAHEAGLATEELEMAKIGWHPQRREFTDEAEMTVRTIFKLYPWEWIWEDAFGAMVAERGEETQWIEPAWKGILSTKAILAELWRRYPDHPNLLPAFTTDPGAGEWVRKPFFSREGSNILMPGRAETAGPYGGPYVWQKYSAVPEFSGRRPVLGSWIVGGEPRGLGIRETDGEVTDDLARFVPHLFR